MGAFFILLFVLAALLLGGLYLAGLRNAAKAAAAAPKIGQETATRGGSIHWVESGPAEGRPVLCLHGLSGNLRHFTYALTPLLSDEFRVIAIDRPGCGYSRRRGAEDAPLPEQARMIADFLDREGVERPLVVGHSLGGALALTLALDHPDKVSGLALLAPATMPVEEVPPMFKALTVQSPGLRAFLGHTLIGALAPLKAEETTRAVFAPETPPADFDAKAGGILAVTPRGYIVSSEDLVHGAGGAEALAARYATELRAPGGVLYGAADAVISPERHGRGFTKTAPSLRYEEIEGAGHMLPILWPERCAAFIRAIARETAENAAPQGASEATPAQ
ncbi:MAG: alpha/beta hydrolase [Pseudomonadota bacterium]